MNKIFKTTMVLALGLAGFASCNDWLDVSPKSQIKEDEQFGREGGYQDQLTGVYTAMSSTSMYGLNMGIGFAEVLSQNYDIDGNGTWRYANDYDYSNSNVESTISTVWSSTYSAIANLNIMIRNIDKADSIKFQNNHYYTYKGEAYGLRGFLYLDLMRLFACAPAMDNNAKGVPYVTEYSTDVVPQKTVGETMQLVVADLLKAREALQHDSLKIGYSPYKQRSSRTPYFNYYAATLTLARAYLWMGDKDNALKCAQEIIDIGDGNGDSKPFSFVHYTSMESSKLNENDLAFSCEQIFHLKINDWEDIANKYFTSKGGSDALTPSETKAQEIYEVLSRGYGNDYRYLRGYEQDGTKKYMCKLWYIDGSAYNNLYPMLRMTEAYYIAAECLKESNPEKAVKLLNTVRSARNLSLFPLDYTTMSADDIQNEIYKEYRKEFVGEGGQLFFYYKRLNASEIKGASVKPGKSVYVLPVPSNDQEFGGYEN